jgi:hypothetical protein
MKARRRHLRLAPVAALTLALVASPALAQETARLPKPRPPTAAGEKLVEWAAGMESRFADAEELPSPETTPEAEPSPSPAHAVEAVETLARAPRPRPEPDLELLAMVAPDAQPEPPSPPVQPPVPTETDAEYSACLGRLRALGVTFSEEDAIDPHGACAVDRPISVSSVGSGVDIEPEAVMNCATAEALARWTAEVMLPAADKLLAAKPQRIMHGSTYVCRPRNNVAGAKLSEHARANAVDIMSIVFADREPVGIGDTAADKAERSFENDIRAGGCDYFTTVLGPGSNAAHATHLHFDLAQRRGGYRLCELGTPVASGAGANTRRE